MILPDNIEAIETVNQHGKYLLDILNDILDLSKIEAGDVNVELIECSPVGAVKEVIELMDVRAIEKDLSLSVRFRNAIPERIVSDPTRLRQILLNLVGNAVKFTEEGFIRVELEYLERADSNRLRFSVVDSGIGLTDDQVTRIFEPFSQADSSTTRKLGGTGLGLAISNRLAKRLGGAITVDSNFGEGSTFLFEVNAALAVGSGFVKSREACEQQVSKQSTKPPSEASNLSGYNILLAEDQAVNQILISKMLKQAGADVTIVDNGEKVLQAIEAAKHGRRSSDPIRPFHVILMDMQMPVLDGYSTATQLREDGYAKTIIALTAHAMSEDRKKCIDAGCDDYLTKPVDRPLMLSKVAEWKPKKSPRSPKTAKVQRASKRSLRRWLLK
ncbi:MAG: hypothetical protein CMJ78_06600 [Planctomycetaceae bacterium]|nr:hypothetical protein [Planctomycetaceae bacterium]